MKIIIYENRDGFYMATTETNRQTGIDTSMKIPIGYTFIYSGENLHRTLIKLSNKMDIDHYGVHGRSRGRLQGYYISDLVIEQYKIKNGLEDINSLT